MTTSSVNEVAQCQAGSPIKRNDTSAFNRLGELAQELVEHRVDAIVALATPAVRAAKKATTTIPIVGIGMADPVEDELALSLARPGGNVTGTTFLGYRDDISRS
jgi:ABC-type uncharacterized transport system substrate-binding protein